MTNVPNVNKAFLFRVVKPYIFSMITYDKS